MSFGSKALPIHGKTHLSLEKVPQCVCAGRGYQSLGRLMSGDSRQQTRGRALTLYLHGFNRLPGRDKIQSTRTIMFFAFFPNLIQSWANSKPKKPPKTTLLPPNPEICREGSYKIVHCQAKETGREKPRSKILQWAKKDSTSVRRPRGFLSLSLSPSKMGIIISEFHLASHRKVMRTEVPVM